MVCKEDTLLCEKQVAHMVGCSVYKLQKDRCKGGFLPFIKLGRSIRYRIADVEAYIENQRYTSTSQYMGGDNGEAS